MFTHLPIACSCKFENCPVLAAAVRAPYAEAVQAEGAVLPLYLDPGVLDRVQQGTPGVVIGDRLVELPELHLFLALRNSLEAWEEELRVASLGL